MASTIDVGGVSVPRLAFGLGSLIKWAPNHAYPLPTDSSLEIQQAVDAGFRHFNTGDLYTNNASAAQALRASNLPRKEIFFSLKLNTYASLGCRGREHMIESTMNEIDRFGLDGYVDLLQLHFPPRGYSGQLTNREAWRVLEELKDRGVARVVGVSNWTVEDYRDLFEANDLRHPPQINEYEFNAFLLSDPKAHELHKFEVEHGIIPMNYGFLTVLTGKLSSVQDTQLVRFLRKTSEETGFSSAEILLSWAYYQLGHGSNIVVSSSSNAERAKRMVQLLSNEESLVPAKILKQVEEAAQNDGFEGKTFYGHPHMEKARLEHEKSQDSLKRHLTTHGPDVLSQWVGDNERVSQHACVICAKSKQRCDGDGTGVTPCTRCLTKNRSCVYRSAVGNHASHPTTSQATATDPAASLQEDPCREITPSLRMQTTPQSIDDAALLAFDRETSLSNPFFLQSSLSVPFLPFQAHPQDWYADFGLDDYATSAELMSLCDQVASHDSSVQQQALDPAPSAASAASVTKDPAARPAVEEHDDDVFLVEHVPHVPSLQHDAYATLVQSICHFLCLDGDETFVAALPSERYLDLYIQLYFEHYHARVPILHLPTFQPSRKSWRLILAIATVGSQYSKARFRQKHVAIFHWIILQLVRSDISTWSDMTPLACLQSLFLYQIYGIMSCTHEFLLALQCHRNVLMTMCRGMLSPDGHILSRPRHQGDYDVCECFQTLVFNLPPLLSIAELQLPLPWPEVYWQSGLPEWQRLSSSHVARPVCTMLARIGLKGRNEQQTGPFALLALILSAFVQYSTTRDFQRSMMLSATDADILSQTFGLEAQASLPLAALKAVTGDLCSQPLALREVSTLSSDCGIIARIAAIIVFMPTYVLYPYSRWQTSERGFQRAQLEASAIMQGKPHEARHCMLLATQLFHHFRAKAFLDHLDALMFLISMLYMVAFLELVLTKDETTSMLSGTRTNIVRLDKLSTVEECDEWIKGSAEQRAHIAGIGFLDTHGSSSRIFKETARVMLASSSTSILAARLSEHVGRQVERSPPVFERVDT
ncbi:hypothetical protein AC579_9222 [Pseudocercospora musae]|uniref:Zn(2)-C6 fungal-type domain-containing protein n=1 Tax=Pseudocercospora musae TaxID=113226 RepID=A0A139I1K9_9PEZI|nr:hypothetical protein AC579_9222 [Pseudocercospora musae]